MLGASDTKPQNYQHIGDFAADCKALIDDLRALPTHPKIFLCKPGPVDEQASAGTDNRRLIDAVIPIIESVAAERELSLIDMYASLGGRPNLFRNRVQPIGGEQWIGRSLRRRAESVYRSDL